MLTDKNEILKKWGITLDDIFDPVDSDISIAVIDQYGGLTFWAKMPYLMNGIYDGQGKRYNCYHLNDGKPFDMTGIDWTICCWERSVDESKWIGCLGFFWDRGDEAFELVIGKLESVVQTAAWPCKINKSTGTGYTFFRPLSLAELDEYRRRAVEAGIR
jgi:hypothetical protein